MKRQEAIGSCRDRKEQPMSEENAKTELDLSDEILQQITGGCGACKADVDTFRSNYGEARRHAQLSQFAQHFEDHELASEHAQKSHYHWGIAREAVNRLLARHQDL
jgi:hypothetical protein